MSVIMTMVLDGDAAAIERYAAEHPDQIRGIRDHAVEHGTSWRPGKDESWTWDELYTMPENLFLAYQRGAGERYRQVAIQYLNEPYYDRLAQGQNDLAGRHAYSHVNAMSSAMQAARLVIARCTSATAEIRATMRIMGWLARPAS